MARRLTHVLVGLGLTITIAASAIPPASAAAGLDPLVTARYTGGLCRSGLCDQRLRLLPDGRLLRDGKVVRRVGAARLRELRRAIARIDLTDVRAHPFTGTRPTAYDGSEAVYRFQSITTALASCTWDLERVPAVRIFERIIAAT
jgi:hypothetical protein